VAGDYPLILSEFHTQRNEILTVKVNTGERAGRDPACACYGLLVWVRAEEC
jgi:hypothetical protein